MARLLAVAGAGAWERSHMILLWPTDVHNKVAISHFQNFASKRSDSAADRLFATSRTPARPCHSATASPIARRASVTAL